MQVEGHTASSTVLVAVAVARVRHLLEAAGVEGDQAQAVGDELVGQHRGVDVEVDQVNGDSGDFGLDDATQRVGEREVDIIELEIDVNGIGLEKWQSQRLAKRPWSRLGCETAMPVAMRLAAYLGDLHRRADSLVVHHHRVVLHRGEWRYRAHGIYRVDAGVASAMGLAMTAAQLSKALRVDALTSFA